MRLFPNRLEKKREKWALWRWCDIVVSGVLYLTRLGLVKTPFGTVKLHWIHQPDPDRGLHDHPWSFVSVVLSGGYTELTYDPDTGECGEQVVKRFNYKNTKTAHRISAVKPNTLTLIITGPRRKSWGFYEDGKYIDWQDYVEPGEAM